MRWPWVRVPPPAFFADASPAAWLRHAAQCGSIEEARRQSRLLDVCAEGAPVRVSRGKCEAIAATTGLCEVGRGLAPGKRHGALQGFDQTLAVAGPAMMGDDDGSGNLVAEALEQGADCWEAAPRDADHDQLVAHFFFRYSRSTGSGSSYLSTR